MAILKKWVLLVVALWAGILSGWAKEPIKALVVTGQNNHNWQVSHLAIQQILENSGLFEVDFAISPAKASSRLDDSIFTPFSSSKNPSLISSSNVAWASFAVTFTLIERSICKRLSLSSLAFWNGRKDWDVTAKPTATRITMTAE